MSVQLNGGDIVPIYNIEPPLGSPAEFGFFYNSIVVTLLAKVRPSDNGIDIVTAEDAELDPDPEVRGDAVGRAGRPLARPAAQRSACRAASATTAATARCGTDRVPFLRTPTSCPATPLPWGIDIDTYQHPGTFVHNRHDDRRRSSGARPTRSTRRSRSCPRRWRRTRRAGSTRRSRMDQDYGPDGIAPADLRSGDRHAAGGHDDQPVVGRRAGRLHGRGAGAGTGRRGGLSRRVEARHRHAEIAAARPSEVSGTIFLRTQNSDDPHVGGAVPHRGGDPLRRRRHRHQAARRHQGEPDRPVS